MRLFIRFLSLYFCVLFGASQPALAGSGLGGFYQKLDKSMLVWGSFVAPSSVNAADRKNAKFELYAKPRIRLYQFDGKTKLMGYSIISVLGDSQKLSYNNKVTYSLGIELERKLSKAVRLSFGVKWVGEEQYLTGKSDRGFVATADLSIYKQWKPDWLRKGRFHNATLVLSGWGNIRYPGSLDITERNNGLIQGSLKLALVLPLKGSKLKFAPFASVLAKADTKGRAWNNTLEPAIGAELKIPIGKGGTLSAGAKVSTQFRHATGTSETGGVLYLSWFKNY